MSTEDFERPSELAARARRLIDETDAVLRAIEGAAARLEEGRYGECESCGAQLSIDRLASDPTARLCEAHRVNDGLGAES